jgi:hypothetical protein
MIEQFKQFNEVSEIWSNDKDEYFIILDNEKYDSNLMHKFIEIEKKNFNQFCDIHYVPSLLFDRNWLYGYKKIY